MLLKYKISEDQFTIEKRKRIFDKLLCIDEYDVETVFEMARQIGIVFPQSIKSYIKQLFKDIDQDGEVVFTDKNESQQIEFDKGTLDKFLDLNVQPDQENNNSYCPSCTFI